MKKYPWMSSAAVLTGALRVNSIYHYVKFQDYPFNAFEVLLSTKVLGMHWYIERCIGKDNFFKLPLPTNNKT